MGILKRSFLYFPFFTLFTTTRWTLLPVSLFFIGLLSSHNVWADRYCALILGDKHDWNSAFSAITNGIVKESREKVEGVSVGSFKCFPYDSWQAADRSLKEKILLSSSGKLNPEDEVLFLQFAHGYEGTGNPNLNNRSQLVSSKIILKIINTYATQAKVSAVLDSCYSGEYLRRKLLEDIESVTPEDAKKNVCLTTTSPFNNVGYGGGLTIPQVGQNMLDFYLQNSRFVLQSSAPWSESKLDQFYTQKESQAEIVFEQFIQTLKGVYKNKAKEAKLADLMLDKKNL
jgi:hypothetical protein